MTQIGGRTPDQLSPGLTFTVAELLAVPEAAVEGAVRTLVKEALGAEAAPGATLVPVGYVSGSPATAALHRLTGATTGGRPWSLFCKVLQHVRHWPMLPLLPPEARDHFASTFPWRSELELWDSSVLATLPDGLRAPVLHRLVEMGDDRVAVWMEDVAQSPAAYDVAWFERAAYLIGRWNARSTAADVLAACPLPTGFALRMYAEQAVPDRGLAPLASDDLWSHPWLVEHADLRTTLLTLGARIPVLLDRLDTFVQAMPHGDASPQNLLVPVEDPDGLVAIDISFRAPHALGFDLGQLLVGLVHAGELPAARLPGVAAAIVPAYVRGLEAEGLTGYAADVREAFVTSVLLRSGFDGFLYGLIEDPTPENRHTFDERVALCRFLADQYLATVTP